MGSDTTGLYAIHGSPEVWMQLGLGAPPDRRPLYLGKAEKSLVDRDLKTTFRDGGTGRSTTRRSLAALLHDTHDYRGRPRNPERPERFANFGLCERQETRLSAWMHDRLELAVWPRPADCPFELRVLEGELLRKLEPPLNIAGVTTPWTAMVKAARAVMAAEARAWADGKPD